MGVQYANYEHQLSFDYYQIDKSETAVSKDKSHILHNRSKLVKMHNRLQWLSIITKYQKDTDKQKATKAKYRWLSKQYQIRLKHYRKMKSIQDQNVNSADSNLHSRQHKIHRLSVNKWYQSFIK